MGLDQAVVLAAYDRLRREQGPPAPGWTAEADEETVLLLPPPGEPGATVVWSRLDGRTADAAIARQAAAARRRGGGLEWKHHDHDEPRDLPGRLLAAGFVPEPAETLVAAGLAALVAATAGLGPPAGVRLRELDDGDAEAVVELAAIVRGDDRRWLVDAVLAERVAEADDASPSSRPVLERLGFVPLAATTPYAVEPE
ncbi:hypothetical protein [Motilibacter aurantiacus]|uniref:hypothetical protein n=1 Tax=Motilibacter aurantiacus TaxID=2714955 RepID=UPI00140B130F|nr:hypothetical protein [Motilibacter aurantiacus]NHC46619.1 hypothetical protein [Motilibacter aurantiacus]